MWLLLRALSLFLLLVLVSLSYSFLSLYRGARGQYTGRFILQQGWAQAHK